MKEIRTNELTADQFLELCRSSGWNMPPAGQVQKALAGSLCTFSAWESSVLAGMVRVCGDGAMCFVIRDLVVAPAFRKKGMGTALVNRLLDYINSSLEPGMKACVELQSALDKEAFYARFGFRIRPSCDQGAGMSLIWQREE